MNKILSIGQNISYLKIMKYYWEAKLEHFNKKYLVTTEHERLKYEISHKILLTIDSRLMEYKNKSLVLLNEIKEHKNYTKFEYNEDNNTIINKELNEICKE